MFTLDEKPSTDDKGLKNGVSPAKTFSTKSQFPKELYILLKLK